METKQSWERTQRFSYISEETGVLKMSDGYTLEDLEILMGSEIDWEYLDEYCDEDYAPTYVKYATTPSWALLS